MEQDYFIVKAENMNIFLSCVTKFSSLISFMIDHYINDGFRWTTSWWEKDFYTKVLVLQAVFSHLDAVIYFCHKPDF